MILAPKKRETDPEARQRTGSPRRGTVNLRHEDSDTVHLGLIIDGHDESPWSGDGGPDKITHRALATRVHRIPGAAPAGARADAD